MKKISYVLCALLCTLSLNAQQNEDAPRKNELMLDPIVLVAASVINVSYERLLSENSGVGINALAYLGNKDDHDAFSQFSPYYRMYFGKKYAAGFFVEGFVPVTTTSYNYYYDYYNGNGYYHPPYKEEKTATTIGIGVGFGGKWLTRNNILFEVSGGVARRFGDHAHVSELTLKGLLGIGYRF